VVLKSSEHSRTETEIKKQPFHVEAQSKAVGEAIEDDPWRRPEEAVGVRSFYAAVPIDDDSIQTNLLYYSLVTQYWNDRFIQTGGALFLSKPNNLSRTRVCVFAVWVRGAAAHRNTAAVWASHLHVLSGDIWASCGCEDCIVTKHFKYRLIIMQCAFKTRLRSKVNETRFHIFATLTNVC